MYSLCTLVGTNYTCACNSSQEELAKLQQVGNDFHRFTELTKHLEILQQLLNEMNFELALQG